MKSFKERLSEALILRNMTAADLSRKTNIDEGTLSNYRKGKYEPKQRKLEAIAKALNVSIPWLMGADVQMQPNAEQKNIFSFDNIQPMPEMKKVPRLGTIACGEPILANEEHGEFDTLPIEIKCDFTLVCKGDSMINARIYDGDIVAIKAQPIVENGEIAAVIIEDEATLKRVYQIGDTLILQAENPSFADLQYHGAELNQIRILGKAVYFISQVR